MSCSEKCRTFRSFGTPYANYTGDGCGRHSGEGLVTEPAAGLPGEGSAERNGWRNAVRLGWKCTEPIVRRPPARKRERAGGDADDHDGQLQAAGTPQPPLGDGDPGLGPHGEPSPVRGPFPFSPQPRDVPALCLESSHPGSVSNAFRQSARSRRRLLLLIWLLVGLRHRRFLSRRRPALQKAVAGGAWWDILFE